MTRRNILFIITSANFLLNYSHWGDVLNIMCKYVNCTIICDESVKNPPHRANCIITRNRFSKHRILRYIIVPLLMLIKGLKVALRADYVVIFSGGPSNIVGFLLSKIGKRKLIVGLRTDLEDWRILKLTKLEKILFFIHEILVKFVLKNAYKVIVFYFHLYKFARRIGIEREKIVLTYIGSNLHKFNYCYNIRRTGKYVIGFAGRATYENGVDILINLAYHLPDVEVLWIGNEPNINNIPRNIIFTGYIPHDQLTEYLCKLDLFLSFKRVHGIPVAVMEAMACGIPVLGVNLDDLRYLIQDETTRKYVLETSAENILDLVSKIRYLLENPELRVKISNEMYRIANKYFDMEKNIIRVLRILYDS